MNPLVAALWLSLVTATAQRTTTSEVWQHPQSNCTATATALCGASRERGTQPTGCQVCASRYAVELVEAGCTDATIEAFCNPAVGFGGPKLHFDFDLTGSLRQISAKGRPLLLQTTPTWQLTTTDCGSVFPAGEAVSSLSAPRGVRFTHSTPAYLETTDHYTAVLRWENVEVNSSAADNTVDVEVRLTLASPDPPGAEPAVATIGGSVRSPAGICVQSFALLDLRGLRWEPETGDRMFLPYESGSVSDCGRHDVGPCPQWVPAGQPGGDASFPELLGPMSPSQRAQQPWMPGGTDTMGWRALLFAASNTSAEQALYLGAHDPKGRLKMMPAAAALLGRTVQGALLRVLHIPDSQTDGRAKNWTIAYDTVLAIVEGGWWDAAQVYRGWALQHADWAATGSLKTQLDKGTLPAWAVETPFMTRGNGNCEYPQAQANLLCADKMMRLQQLLGGNVPLAMHWYGWNAELFDTKYPHYTALEGVGAEVAKMRSAGIRVFPYTNGRLYDPSLPEWSAEDAISVACGCFRANQTATAAKPTDACDATGAPGYYREVISSGDGLAVMDPSTAQYRKKLADVSAAVVNSTTSDGIYLDELGASHSLRCFQRGGAGSGGHAWAEGTRLMLAGIRDSVRAAREDTPVPIISEAMNEQYLGLVPLNLAIYNHEFTSHCTSVPAYQAVYGGWSLNVGDNRYPWSSRAAAAGENWVPQQRGMLAQQFVEGQVMGWMALEELAMWAFNETHSDDVAYFGKLARLRVQASDFLVHGRLWRPPTIEGVPPTATLSQVSVCDFASLGDAPITAAMCCTIPTVQGAAWLGTNNSLGLVLTNHGVSAQHIAVSVSLPQNYPATGGLRARSVGTEAQPGVVCASVQRSADGQAMRMLCVLHGRTAGVYQLAPVEHR